MTSLVLRLNDIKMLSAAISPHISKDNVTPVLTHAVTGGRFGNYVVASDRYTVGRYDMTNIIDESPEEEFFIPGVALKAIAAIGPASLPNEIAYDYYRVHLEYLEVGKLHYLQARVVYVEGDEAPMTHWMRTWLIPGSSRFPMKFPSVDKFFESALSEPMEKVTLSGKHLEKFIGFARLNSDIIRVSSTKNVGTDNQHASPVLVEIGPRFKAFIQPMTAFSADGFGPDLLALNAQRIAEEQAKEEDTTKPEDEVGN